jgi:hypothetical protein
LPCALYYSPPLLEHEELHELSGIRQTSKRSHVGPREAVWDQPWHRRHCRRFSPPYDWSRCTSSILPSLSPLPQPSPFMFSFWSPPNVGVGFSCCGPSRQWRTQNHFIR